MVELVRTGSVLVLGDGNFSFTKAFCRRLDFSVDSEHCQDSSSFRVSASVRETESDLLERYPEAEACVRELETRGVKLIYGLDATRLEALRDNRGNQLQFDHIIFNFPHVGGKTNLRKSRQLLLGVFTGVKNALKREGRFYLTLAKGQSGLALLDAEPESSSQLPLHHLDSWQPLHLAAYAQLIVDGRNPFLASEWSSYGYTCAGYKNTSRRFRVEGAETLLFHHSVHSATVDTLDIIPNESHLDTIHTLRPYFTHDIAFWIPDSFTVDKFVETVRLLTKGLVKRVANLAQYNCREECELDGGVLQRTSLCYRFIWQSSRSALTREAARDLQLLLRERLPKCMFDKYSIKIELR